jgi:YggT family protein
MMSALGIAAVTIFLNLLVLYKWIIIISTVLTWVQADRNNPIVQVLNRLTYPAYRFINRIIPMVFNGVDLSPLVLIISLQFIEIFVTQLFFG